jgi:acetyl-CoA carboxylase carboxyl transferase subunit beta
MNWISNFVRPKIRALVQKTEVPENLWQKCDACGAMIHRVCPQCSYHMRIGPAERLALLFDDGQFNRIELPDVPGDPLKFRDRRRYTERLKEAQSKTGDKDALVVAHGTLGGKPLVAAVFNFAFMGGSMGIAVGRRRYTERLKEAQSKTGDKDALVVAHGTLGGKPLVAAVFNFAFMGGSMGIAVGEALIAAARLAVLQESALLVVPSSGGARMQEGILSLMQMPRTVIAVNMVKEAGLPYLVLLTDPTTPCWAISPSPNPGR